MKITVIYDNEVWREGLRSDWGFYCLVDLEGVPKILFDVGAKGSILLQNMGELGIGPEDIDEIFISHSHWDHTGGISSFLDENRNVKVYTPTSYSPPSNAKEIIEVKDSTQIHESIFSTGELAGVKQSLVVESGNGLVVIAGCSHPGIGRVLDTASQFGNVFALVGGFHGFREFDRLKGLGSICPCHCTEFKSEIHERYPEKSHRCGAGKILEFG